MTVFSLRFLLFTSELFEISHIRTIYHMFIAVLLIFCLSTLAVDYIDQGRSVWYVHVCALTTPTRVKLHDPKLNLKTQKPLKTSYSLLIFFFSLLCPSLPPSLPASLLICQQKDRAISPSEYFCCCFGQLGNDLVAVCRRRAVSLMLMFLTGRKVPVGNSTKLFDTSTLS